VLSGSLGRESLPRLVADVADSLTPLHVAVQYRLSGVTEMGRPALVLEIEADVPLRCQRCLGLYQQPISLRTVLPVARDEVELARWESDDPMLDALVAEPDMDVVALVEDEVLLSLPVVPEHPEGCCPVEKLI